jgi:hypothetical protein
VYTDHESDSLESQIRSKDDGPRNQTGDSRKIIQLLWKWLNQIRYPSMQCVTHPVESIFSLPLLDSEEPKKTEQRGNSYSVYWKTTLGASSENSRRLAFQCKSVDHTGRCVLICFWGMNTLVHKLSFF